MKISTFHFQTLSSWLDRHAPPTVKTRRQAADNIKIKKAPYRGGVSRFWLLKKCVSNARPDWGNRPVFPSVVLTAFSIQHTVWNKAQQACLVYVVFSVRVLVLLILM